MLPSSINPTEFLAISTHDFDKFRGDAGDGAFDGGVHPGAEVRLVNAPNGLPGTDTVAGRDDGASEASGPSERREPRA